VPNAESVKVGAYTPRTRVEVTVRLPDVPVMVTLYWPTGTELLAVKVSVLLPVVGLGVKEAVTPLGRPDAESATLPVNPYCEYTYTLEVPELPWPMLALDAESVKVGA
jgi:hypothetical protein